MTSNVQLVPTTSVDALNKTLDTPPLDPVVLAIANDFLSGKSIEEMSDEYGVSQDRITSVVEKKEVKIYIDSVFATQGYLNRVKPPNILFTYIFFYTKIYSESTDRERSFGIIFVI